jgi:hypothetical protein
MVAFAVAVVGALVAAFAPLGRECSSTAIPSLGSGTPVPAVEEVCRGISTFSVDGSWVLVVVSVPVVIALVPVIWQRRWVRICSAVLLWACCVVALFSVGISQMTASVLSSSDAMEAAFWSAERTTLVGSMTPASTRFS